MDLISEIPENALILVAVAPEPKDMEIARLLGWYRIPLRMAPKLIDVDYILFYQTGKFPSGHQSLIEAYAEVKGHELTTRAELVRDEPSHPRAREEYYKISLGPLEYLKSPIISRGWKRISFFYTLGHLVNNASVVNDLVVRSEERDILWKTIHERNLVGYGKQIKKANKIPEDELLKLLERVLTLNAGLGLLESGVLNNEIEQG